MQEIHKSGPPTGMTLISANDLREWQFTLTVLGESVFEGETFALRFRFTDNYPLEAPEVVFLTTSPYKAPEHPHIYSNGHCCVSILSTEWSPVLNVTSVLLTMQSMLASCKKKERPKDNDRYIKHAPLSPRDTVWSFHDEYVRGDV
jgi:ubiquitin-conjugating enzyme E2 W